MHGIHAGADPHCYVEANGGPKGATICIHLQMVEKHNVSIQAHRGLTTIAKQPGQGKQGTPFTTTYIYIAFTLKNKTQQNI